ncbi:MAG: glycosyltransferase, partial [Ktedonobacterales bacterium]
MARVANIPGWQASVNGHPTPIRAWNTAMQQIAIPAGTSTIELKYWPPRFTVGLWLAALGLLLLLLCWLTPVFGGTRRTLRFWRDKEMRDVSILTNAPDSTTPYAENSIGLSRTTLPRPSQATLGSGEAETVKAPRVVPQQDDSFDAARASRRTSRLFLSIVIPTYNEEQRLPPTLQAIQAFLEEQGLDRITEVLIADDGSRDHTVKVAAAFLTTWPRLTIVSLPHRGKGSAVRNGVLRARGEYIFMCDADLSMPISELLKFLPPHSPECDIVIGSREAHGARRFNEKRYRHIMGRVFNSLVQALVLPGVHDSQCGFKLIKRDAAQALFTELVVDGMSFDVELLTLARFYGYSMSELGIDWYHKENSRVRPVRDTSAMFREVWRMRGRVRRMKKALQATARQPGLSQSTPTLPQSFPELRNASDKAVTATYIPTRWMMVNRALEFADRLTGGKAAWIQRLATYLMVGGFAAVVNLSVFAL